jgi:hypothetical protein
MIPSSNPGAFRIGSKSGRSFLNVRLSRRFLLKSTLVLATAALVTMGSFWLAEKVWGRPPGAIGSVYHLPAGPWGELTAQPILIEAPGAVLSTNFRLGDGRWYFRARHPVEVEGELRRAGLDAAVIPGLLATWQPVPGHTDLGSLLPAPDVVRSLTPEVRTALYEHLSGVPENFAQAEPFRITDTYLDDWLEPDSLPPDLIRQVKSLMWRRGNTLLFSDYNLVVDNLTSPALKLELLKQLTRKASLIVKLKVPGGSDVEPLVAFWGAGGRADKVRPLLRSIADSGGADLDISNLLPVFARQRLYRFPDPLPDSDLGPGCHWAAFNFFATGAPDDSLHEAEGVERLLYEDFAPATGEPRFGDIILLTLPDGSSIHSAVYVADGIVFTKNGPSLATPYVLSTLEDMLAFYPSEEKITLTYYRRRGI